MGQVVRLKRDLASASWSAVLLSTTGSRGCVGSATRLPQDAHRRARHARCLRFGRPGPEIEANDARPPGRIGWAQK